MKSLKIFLLISLYFTLACSHRKLPEENLMSRVAPSWFVHSPTYSLQDLAGQPRPHLFFDVRPDLNKQRSHINFVPLVKAQTDKVLGLDLVSGQRYFSHFACMSNDLWKESKRHVARFPYTIGVVPRILDQLGEPQQILVFGGQDRFDLSDDIYYRVKIIGGVVEQVCPFGKCTSLKTWLSRLSLVAVYEQDPEFGKVSNIEDLLKIIPWEEIKVAHENLSGGNKVASTIFPAVKLGRPLPQMEVMDYLLKRNIEFNDESLMGIRHSCHKLYQKFWKDVGKERIFDRPAKNREELVKQLKIREDRKKKRLPVAFNQRLHYFFKDYVDQFYTCSKFHYVGNVNKNPEKFWFLTYMSLFVKLHKKGYFYDCRSRSWQINMNQKNKDNITDLKTDLSLCTTQEIDLAFEYLDKNLKSLKSLAPESFRFIDYDNHEFGTHQKVYSWIESKNRSFSCTSDREEKLKDLFPIMPTEIKWNKRHHFDLKDDLGVID